MQPRKAAKHIVRWGLARVKAQASELIERRILAQTGLRSIGDTDPDDVYICGFPKSGNTWFQHMVTGLVYGVDVSVAPDTLINELMPDVHYKRYYRRFGTPMFFKSHHLPEAHYRRVVYLIRDGRDAMVSYWHHLNAVGPGVDFLNLVTDSTVFPGKWHVHVDSFRRNPHGSAMLMIKYEDLKADPLTQLRKLAEFAGFQRSPEAYERAIQQSSFQKMQDKERAGAWDTTNWPRDRKFVRRGQVGSFKDEMPADVLAAFLREAGPTLAAVGYSIDSP